MSTPRDRDGDGFDDGTAGWQEPAHLGGGADGPAGPGPREEPARQPEAWQPPGWDLPAAEPERRGAPPVVVPPADPWGTQAWALSIGWELSDGTGPQDAALAPLVRSAPVRPGKDDTAGRVLRGRGNGLDLVAFDI